MGLKAFIISLMAVVICSLFMLIFIGNMISVQNPSSELLGPGYGLNTSIRTLNNTITQFANTSSFAKSELVGSNPSAVDYLFLIFKGAFYIPLAFLLFGVNGVIALGNMLVLGLGGGTFGLIATIGIGLITSSLIAILVFYIIKFIRTGVE